MCNSYVTQDQDDFNMLTANKKGHETIEEEDEEMQQIEATPLFKIRQARTMIDDADDHISFKESDIIKDLEKS